MDDKRKKNRWIAREAASRWAQAARDDEEAEWVTAAEFKTHCLRLIEEVRQGRGNVVITRYGEPVARLVPYDTSVMSLFGHLSGTVVSYGDLVSPVDEAWDADT
jgi:prevent-host-death family protein